MSHKKPTSLIFILMAITVIFSIPGLAGAFVQEYQYSEYDAPGFFWGIWHGLLAPWSLVVRWFIDDVVMYAVSNSGWFYDFGFLIGIAGSLPIGWVAAIISTLGHIFL